MTEKTTIAILGDDQHQLATKLAQLRLRLYARSLVAKDGQADRGSESVPDAERFLLNQIRSAAEAADKLRTKEKEQPK